MLYLYQIQNVKQDILIKYIGCKQNALKHRKQVMVKQEYE